MAIRLTAIRLTADWLTAIRQSYDGPIDARLVENLRDVESRRWSGSERGPIGSEWLEFFRMGWIGSKRIRMVLNGVEQASLLGFGKAIFFSLWSVWLTFSGSRRGLRRRIRNLEVQPIQAGKNGRKRPHSRSKNPPYKTIRISYTFDI